MDGQNANGGGFPLNQNFPPQNAGANTNQNPTPNDSGAFFSDAQNTQPQATPSPESFIVMPNQGKTATMPTLISYENARTTSLIQSERDNVQAQLDQMHAQNMAATRRVRRKAAVEKAAQKGTKILIAIVVFVILSLIAVIGYNIYLNTQKPQPIAPTPVDPVPDPDPNPDPDPDQHTGVKIGEYECENADCSSVADLPDGRKVINDGGYKLLDPQTNDTIIIAIDDQEYRGFVGFAWGDRILLEIDSNTGSGLYSITDNRKITEFAYDSFIRDANDPAYADQQYIIGPYIIAVSGEQFRMINITDGKEKIFGTSRVFNYQNTYFVGVNGLTRKVYSDSGVSVGTFVYSDTKNDLAYVEKSTNYLIHVQTSTAKNGKVTAVLKGVYDTNGQKLANNDDNYKRISTAFKDAQKANPSGPFDGNANFYRLP